MTKDFDAGFRSRSKNGIWKVRRKRAESLAITSFSLKSCFAVKSSRFVAKRCLVRKKKA